MLHPDGAARLAWDVVMLVLIAALLLYIPVTIAFYAPATECVFAAAHRPRSVAEPHAPAQAASGVQFMAVTNFAFMADIILNFLTGVRSFNPDTGMVEYSYSFRHVAKTYARTWLLLDVVSVLPLECMVAAAGRANNFNAGHVNRLLRVFSFRRRAHGDPFRVINLLPFLSSNFNYSARLVVVAFTALLVALHYFACALWLLLRVQDFPPGTWPVMLGLLDNLDILECWTWSIFAVTSAMIGLGYGSFPPMTFPEAQLWIVEMIVMAAGFATVNGFILSAILEFLSAQARYKTKLLQAKREVQRRGLPPRLGAAVMAYFKLKHRGGGEDAVDGGAVLAELPPALRLQVTMSTVGSILAQIPVLRESRQLLQRVALLVEHQVAAEGQLISIPGTPHTHVYYLTKGYADVYMGDALIETLVAGDAFGEPALLPVPPRDALPPHLGALWAATPDFSARSWPCLFTVRALSACSLVVLDGGAFAELLEEYPWAEEHMRDLGRRHAQVLDELRIDGVWRAAAGADPLYDPAATAITRLQGLKAKAAEARRKHSGGGGGGGDALARPGGLEGARQRWHPHLHHHRRAGGDGGGGSGSEGGGSGGGDGGVGSGGSGGGGGSSGGGAPAGPAAV
ncbi:MAG: cyclic nucleotide-binding-like protein [Monoraphidium minutum]|nr:MAG: cyclic nucleotide-binding-like protein [Monoraphidium minutum]